MATTADALRALTALTNALPQIAEQALRESEAEVIDTQQEQMFSGTDRNGRNIGSYAPLTREIKAAKGLPYDRVTGYDTGSMYRQMYLIVGNGKFAIGSRSDTFGPFTERFSEAFGISKQYAPEVVLALRPKFIQEVRKITGFK